MEEKARPIQIEIRSKGYNTLYTGEEPDRTVTIQEVIGEALKLAEWLYSCPSPLSAIPRYIIIRPFGAWGDMEECEIKLALPANSAVMVPTVPDIHLAKRDGVEVAA